MVSGRFASTPVHWARGPLRRFCSITLGKMIAGTSDTTGVMKPYLRAAHVQPDGVLRLTDVKEMPFSLHELTRLSLASGDVVIVEGGAGYGRPAVLRDDLHGWGFQNSINRVRSVTGDGRYIQYSLLAAHRSGYFETLINTATIPHLTAEKLADVQVVWPPYVEQRQIADYLDAQTAKIDALIGKQEQLIETLAERRQAVISHAVTKGLDPNAPMKDSGVEWAGAVPEHWNAGNIRRFSKMKTGHTPRRSVQEYWTDCDIPWFTLADVWQLRAGARYLGETTGNISKLGLANSAAELLPTGTVVLSRTASVGFSGIMPAPMATSQDFWNWVCDSSLQPIFLWYQFLAMRPYFASLMHGSTHKTIYQADAAGLGVTVPPVVEQDQLIAHLDHETARIDALSAKAREMIGVLKERRQALISAAVTGKIDVRGLV